MSPMHLLIMIRVLHGRGKHLVQLTSKGKNQAVLGSVMLDLKLLNDSGHVLFNKTKSYPKLML